MPAIVNLPAASKPAVATTVSVEPSATIGVVTFVDVVSVTVTLSATEPLQPVMFWSSCVPSFLAVYLHVPSIPVTVKVPLEPNSAVDLSFSVVPSDCAPSTALVAGAAFVSSKESLSDGCSGNDSPA